jgi:hypothetical protein
MVIYGGLTNQGQEFPQNLHNPRLCCKKALRRFFLALPRLPLKPNAVLPDRPNFTLNCLGINTIDPIDLSSDAEKRPLSACDTGVSKLESRLRSNCVGGPVLHRHHNDGVRTQSVFPRF